ncbi:Cof-type HAD-IIB family hydrolase [Virgibacillus oceani]|uniref:5-amino-6-(5-phospho-D-ribitylamino)uracil phosphatase YcsE n=1 Tax=Virgibacillus oceani TaxID=1479511 RepID=A0A917HAJ9_9BACI|nr:Cof-type HAD-IIB family hydrolase [Virgibacillus oceani]GGG73049.1 5-amino-6-(5-phospho-D-ribitylamino)uracil phosphatase YcsE [Virgibacillus oceani]
MVNYRLLALDLDETLLTGDKRITDETKYWISQAKKAGVIVIFATGRGLQRIGYIREELNLDTPMVLVNGAEIWEKPGKLLARYFISRKDIRMLHTFAVDAGASYWGYSVESLTGPGTWSDEMFDRNWMKFGIRHDDCKVIQEIKKQAANSTSLEITSSSSVNLEFSFKGISKKSGVGKVCNLLNINMEKVMAIGDNLNDLQLIQSAGLGIAMGNADIRLKEAADEITGTNEENGVARAIQRYIFGLNQDIQKEMSSLGDL